MTYTTSLSHRLCAPSRSAKLLSPPQRSLSLRRSWEPRWKNVRGAYRARWTATLSSYSVCGVEVSSQVLQRVIFHLVERRGHLLLDCLPRGVYFLAEATRDLEAFLEQNPLYAPPHEGAVGEFVENVWRSVSGKRSRSCTLWRKRKSGQGKENVAEESLSSTVISSPNLRTQPSSLPQPSLGEASLKPRSSRVVRFPSL